MSPPASRARCRPGRPGRLPHPPGGAHERGAPRHRRAGLDLLYGASALELVGDATRSRWQRPRRGPATGSSACASGPRSSEARSTRARGGRFRVTRALPYRRRRDAPIRVLLVDDDALMRAGLEAILSSDAGIAVVGEASDGRVAVAEVRRAETGRCPDGHPHARARRDRRDARGRSRSSPDVRVVILTTFEEDDYIFGALRAGASGFLLKRTRPEELMEALRAVAAGDSLLSPSVTRRVIDRMAAARRGTRSRSSARRADGSGAGGARAARARLSNAEVAAGS